VRTGKRTMAYMPSPSRSFPGPLTCYLLWNVRPVPGQTLNAVLATSVLGTWPLGGLLALITIFSEAALLCVAAQTGFIDGPRVMANMAIDSWLPRSFALLSERLTMTNGILLMGGSALFIMLFTRGSIIVLITMYAINVFLTFSISESVCPGFSIKPGNREGMETAYPDPPHRPCTVQYDPYHHPF